MSDEPLVDRVSHGAVQVLLTQRCGRHVEQCAERSCDLVSRPLFYFIISKTGAMKDNSRRWLLSETARWHSQVELAGHQVAQFVDAQCRIVRNNGLGVA